MRFFDAVFFRQYHYTLKRMKTVSCLFWCEIGHSGRGSGDKLIKSILLFLLIQMGIILTFDTGGEVNFHARHFLGSSSK
jgi:hypothetical protein